MAQSSIYMDYAATTPVDESVIESMQACLGFEGNFGNAASTSHLFGWHAAEAVETARAQVATLLNADVREIVFTSGATESDNLALFGVARYRAKQGASPHIITSTIEHKAVLDCCAQLEKEGFSVTYLVPSAQGVISADDVANAMTDDTALVSIMHANNETGVVNDVASIGAVCRAKNIVFHVDAAQSVGKLAIDVKAMNIDLLSISAHKFYGPKGMGALFVSRQPKVEIEPLIYGGGHERGMRSGTLATHQIVGLGAACALASNQKVEEAQTSIAHLRDSLWQGIQDLPGIRRNGCDSAVLAGHLNVCFSGVDGETLLMSLRKLAVSSGSACNSASMKPSYVLTQMGLSDEQADSSIRFSLGKYTTSDDIVLAIEHIRTVYSRLCEI
ncbi:MAG: aminotransferase class V-fold PLP-dependent enzyme [Sinobacterium sp.]|nr:aminotransferase class V-fold PLP-dependent enzyme [Sinobacterium sp.]